MKRGGILNAALNEAISRLGHGDLVVVADRGLPVPPGVAVVDLALVAGIPSFAQVAHALQEEVVFEAGLAAEESADSDARDLITSRFPDIEFVSHSELKRRSASARLFVRTGDQTPYANVVLRCGVAF